MKLVYVASPLRGDVEENIKKANDYCREVAENGDLPFAPHCVFSQYLDDNIPQERELGMNMGLAFLSRCDELLICGGHISEGMTEEIKEALRLDIPIKHHSMENELTDRFSQSQQQMKWAAQCFDLIKNLQTLREAPVEMICLHGQKAAQNLLCSAIAVSGEKQPVSSSLPELLDECIRINPKFNELDAPCNFLASLGEPAYPSERKLTAQDMQTALAHCQEIHKFVLDITPELAMQEPSQEQILSMNEPTM